MLGMQVGLNARAAICSADLARRASAGPHDILVGQYGYFRLFEEDDHDVEAFVPTLGRDWQVLRMSHKPYPSGRLTHGAIDGWGRLMAEHGFGAGDIAAVRVEVPAARPPPRRAARHRGARGELRQALPAPRRRPLPRAGARRRPGLPGRGGAARCGPAPLRRARGRRAGRQPGPERADAADRLGDPRRRLRPCRHAAGGLRASGRAAHGRGERRQVPALRRLLPCAARRAGRPDRRGRIPGGRRGRRRTDGSVSRSGA